MIAAQVFRPERSGVARADKSGDIDHLVVVVAAATKISVAELVFSYRRTGPVARARQLVFYLACTCLDLNYSQVGAAFARDRTTIRHACARTEDRRDNPRFDRWLEDIEKIIHSTLELQNDWS